MSKQQKLRVAACQFAISSDLQANARAIKKYMRQAAKRGADIIQFSETALSGYGGADIQSWENYAWHDLKAALSEIAALAKELSLWLVLGSSHPIKHSKPYNSLYVIAASGRIRARYDKRFCTSVDLEFYTPGENFITFTLKGVKCGCLICYDVRFPELYRAYKKLDVQLMFHSFYNAGADTDNIHTHIMRQSLQAHAASNYMWISASNCAKPHQSWPSVCIQPDGVIKKSMQQNKSGIMITDIDLSKVFYDAAGLNRDLAMDGILSNGQRHEP